MALSWTRAADLVEARVGHSMSFWSTRGQLLIAGGQGEQGIMTLEGANWTIPAAVRTNGSVLLALDLAHNSPMLFGEHAASGADLERGNTHLGPSGTVATGNGGCSTTSLGLSATAPSLGAPLTLQVWDRLPVQQPRRGAGVAFLLGIAADLPFGPCRHGLARPSTGARSRRCGSGPGCGGPGA